MKLIAYFTILFFFANQSYAEYTFRICTQNLNNYGISHLVKLRTKKSSRDLEEQRNNHIKRFIEADCNIIAVQEIIAKSEEQATTVLKGLVKEHQKQYFSKLSYVTGKSNDPFLKLGFLFDLDQFELVKSRSYAGELLPRLSHYERNRYFSRGPLRIDLKHKSTGKIISILNFHFKSKSKFGGIDASGFKFEQDRIQMAQKLKEIAKEIKQSNKDGLILLAGDRNSTKASASSQVLNGKLELQFFKENVCELYENGQADCPKHLDYTNQLKTLLPSNPEDQELNNLIDDILIYKEDIHDWTYKSGMLRPEKKTSDHPLLWAELYYAN